MIMWAELDIAIAVRNDACGCGGHKVQNRKVYRVRHVRKFMGEVFLDVSQPGTPEHFYHHSTFRREQPATQDIFKLADAPVDKRVLEPNF